MKIRKQVFELTVADFERFSVWEFATDEVGESGQDEATVRPMASSVPEGLCVARAKFELADGTVMSGYVTPNAAEDDLADVQPHIITHSGQVGFWFGMMPLEDGDLAEYHRRLGRTVDAIFPIRYSLETHLSDAQCAGIIEGFYAWRNDKTVLVK